MATAQVQHPIKQDPTLAHSQGETGPHPAQVAQEFLDKAQAALSKKDVDAFASLFRADGHLRDILVTDPTDMNSWFGPAGVKAALQKHGVPAVQNLRVVEPEKAKIVDVAPGVQWVQAFTSFETSKIRGKGLVRLQEENGTLKAFTFFLASWEIKGHEEFAYERRPVGVDHGQHEHRMNWHERRQQMVEFENADPVVLVVGAGQNGLMLGARLTVLGIPTLIVERNDRTGDNWRKRYDNLVLHDPVWADHFPYLPYPPHWPIYTPKEKLGNWLESYAQAMELNIWNRSTIEPGSTYDEKTGKWTVVVNRDGKQRTLHPSHLVLATGFSGELRIADFVKNNTEFKGPTPHSNQHDGPQKWVGKNAVVVGACNSGHDIAAAFYEQGAKSVTMIQRSHTYVVSSKHGLPAWLNGFYEENGPPVDDADLMFTSLPVNTVEAFHIESTKGVYEKDAPILDGLEKAGFKVNRYPGGLFIKYFRDGGGYYLDVGCSQLIADGKIKVISGHGVTKLDSEGLVLDDGRRVPADIIVCATGYDSMRTTVKKLISEDVGSRLRTCWGTDAQGEIPTVWRNSGVPGFWLQAGNFFQARTMSKHVAHQIHMQELGLTPKDAPYPDEKEIKDPRF